MQREPKDVAYQSSGVGTVDAVQGHRRLDVLGRGGIGPEAVQGGSARDGELLGGGTQAGADNTSGHHCDERLDGQEASDEMEGEEWVDTRRASVEIGGVREAGGRAGMELRSNVQLLPGPSREIPHTPSFRLFGRLWLIWFTWFTSCPVIQNYKNSSFHVATPAWLRLLLSRNSITIANTPTPVPQMRPFRLVPADRP